MSLNAMRFREVFVATFVASGALLPSLALADDIYVSPMGNDAAAGQLNTPLRTIQAAADAAGPGDTIYVRQGVYLELVQLSRSGESGRPIVLRNYPDESPIIEQGGVQLWAPNPASTPIGWITVEGLEIRNIGNGINFKNGHDLILRKNHVHHVKGQAIHGNGHHLLIDANVLTHTDESCDQCTYEGQTNMWNHGIYSSGTHITITNNIFTNHGGSGVHMAAKSYNPEIDIAPEFRGGTDWVISNNLFAFDNGPGIWVWQPAAVGAVIQNNIFYENATAADYPYNGIHFVSSGDGHIVRNNLFYHSDGKAAFSHPESSGLYTTSDNLFEDPLLVAPLAADFHLLDDSPAFGNGIRDQAPTTDFEGNPRPLSGPISIGPYDVPGRPTGTGGAGGNGATGTGGGGDAASGTGGRESGGNGGDGGLGSEGGSYAAAGGPGIDGNPASSGDSSESEGVMTGGCGCRIGNVGSPHWTWLALGIALARCRKRGRSHGRRIRSSRSSVTRFSHA